MEKVAVVVLNYMNYQETIACVDSILSQKGVALEIVIVDNGSMNESYAVLKRRYLHISNVHVLHARKNYGFAKGNNIGIKYARENLQTNYVLLINSDTVMIDNKYVCKIVSHYDKSIGVIGTEILLRNGRKQKPYTGYVDFPGTLIHYFEVLAQINGMNRLQTFFEKIIKKYKRVEVLHGSAFMLTPSYFDHYKGLFDKTFLYGEEILLYILCRRAKLEQLYITDTQILHKEDQSSKYLFNNQSSIKMKYSLQSNKYIVAESFKDFMRAKRRKAL